VLADLAVPDDRPPVFGFCLLVIRRIGRVADGEAADEELDELLTLLVLLN
jgi:hypothetical protein